MNRKRRRGRGEALHVVVVDSAGYNFVYDAPSVAGFHADFHVVLDSGIVPES